MKFLKDKWTLVIILGLGILSGVFYSLDFNVFHDGKNEFIWFLRTLSFMPIEVLLVTLVIQKLLDEEEKRTKMKKLNMVIGLFFSEVGRDLLSYVIPADSFAVEKKKRLRMGNDWTPSDFEQAIKASAKESAKLKVSREFFVDLKNNLSKRREFMIKLLENSALLEHESFSELLTYIFHLIEELDMRADILKIHDKDLEHLEIDLRRSYGKLVTEWLTYLKHQKKEYPYLYSFSIRTNPFEDELHVEIL